MTRQMTRDREMAVLDLPDATVRAELAPFLASYVDPATPEHRAVHDGMQRTIESAAATDEAVSGWMEGLRALGGPYGGYERDAFGSLVVDAFMQPLVDPNSTLQGLEHLDAAVATGGPVLIVANHQSYADTVALTTLLHRVDRSAVAHALAAAAGPKVYAEPMRRMAVRGVHSIKVAQSTQVAAAQDGTSARALLRVAQECMALAGTWMEEGRLVLLYPEGTRSRDGRLQPFLKAVARWLARPGTTLLPLGLVGVDALYPVDSPLLKRSRLQGRFGPPIRVETVAGTAGRTAILEQAHAAIAAQLPEANRPSAGTPRFY